MNSILPFDELNSFNRQIEERFGTGNIAEIASKQDEEDIIDEMFELFLLSYARGAEAANISLSSSYVPPLDDVKRVLDAKIAGKTWEERVREYFSQGGTAADIKRIAETEAHRDSNAGAFETAKSVGAKEKVWHCMLLPTSRDTHVYLDGVSAPIDGEFYSYMGGSTKYPGQWGIAEEDINCLCWLTFKR